MSSKGRRSTPQPRSSQEQSEQPSSSVQRPTSPVSQILYTRVEEKKNLQGLNDRLAQYIDTVRSLMSENEILRDTIEKTERTIQVETSNVKTLYEKELSDARKTLEKTSAENTFLRMELNKEKAGREEMTNRASKLQKELSSLETRVVAAENDARNARNELVEEVARRKKAETEKKEAVKETDDLKKHLASARKELDDAIQTRTDMTNRLKSLEEAAQFDKQVIQEELNRSRSQVTEVKLHIEKQYEERLEQRLADELSELRAENDEKLRQCRADLHDRFEGQLNQLKTQLQQRTGLEAKQRNEIQTLTSKCSNLESQAKRIESINASLKERVSDLEKQLEQERSWHQQALHEKDQEIASLNEKIKTHLQEYQDLYDVKIALDLEIDTYRKLLEGEESRLESRPTSRASAYSVTPRSGKRKSNLQGFRQEQVEIRVRYASDIKNHGSVWIAETDPEKCRFVKITNNSDQDVALNGWQLQRKVGDEVVTAYKFHRQIVIKAGETVCIWGSTAEGKVHSPPNDLVMKSQSWTSAPEMTTVLLDHSGEESSVCKNTIEKSSSSSPFKRLRASLSGEGEEANNCSIM